MIDRDAFKRTWAQLCARFGKQSDPQQAVAYYEFLTEQLDTQAFIAAARAIWATSTWFPRPVDFVLVIAAGEWRLVLEAVGKYAPPDAAWLTAWEALSERSRAACKQLGGLSAMRTIYDRDVLRLKSEWERAYEQEVANAVAAAALPPGEQPRALPAAGAARRELPRGAGGLDRARFAAPAPQAVHRG